MPVMAAWGDRACRQHTEFLPPYGIIHIEWARECWLNLKIGMFVKPSEEWAQ